MARAAWLTASESFFVGLLQSAEQQVQAKRRDYDIALPDGNCESVAGAVQVTVDGLTADIRAGAVPCLALFRCQEPDPVFFRLAGQQFENLNFLKKFTLESLLRFFRPVLQEFQNLSQGLVAGFNRVIIDSCASLLLSTASIRSTISLIHIHFCDDRFQRSL